MCSCFGALPLQPWLSYCTKRCHKWIVPLTVNRKNLQQIGKCDDAWSWWSSEINLQGNATSPANMWSVLELGLLTDSILPNRSLETVLMFLLNCALFCWRVTLICRLLMPRGSYTLEGLGEEVPLPLPAYPILQECLVRLVWNHGFYTYW